MFEDKIILVTGGTGSWGNELTKQLLEKNPREIRIFSRNELLQVEMARRFENDKLNFIIGDVRDYDALNRACYGVDFVFHLAAMKHVPVCENLPQEAIKTNITGTTNLVNAAIENGVKKVIDVSSDKAVAPVNLYGMTKAVGEKIIIQANNIRSGCDFVCVRAGNVMGSNGSVIPLFIKQIMDNAEIKITHLHMTRFFMTIQEAIGLLFKAVEKSIGGEIFVMNMDSYRLVDLALVLIDSYNDCAKIVEIGIRPGEKIHEVLISSDEINRTYIFDDDYFVIVPSIIKGIKEWYEKKLKCEFVIFKEFSSKTKLGTSNEIQKKLKSGGFLN